MIDRRALVAGLATVRDIQTGGEIGPKRGKRSADTDFKFLEPDNEVIGR